MDNDQKELNATIQNLNVSNDEKKIMEQQINSIKQDHEEQIQKYKEDLSRCAQEKADIIQKLSEIDAEIVEQSSLGKNGFYSNCKSYLRGLLAGSLAS